MLFLIHAFFSDGLALNNAVSNYIPHVYMHVINHPRHRPNVQVTSNYSTEEQQSCEFFPFSCIRTFLFHTFSVWWLHHEVCVRVVECLLSSLLLIPFDKGKYENIISIPLNESAEAMTNNDIKRIVTFDPRKRYKNRKLCETFTFCHQDDCSLRWLWKCTPIHYHLVRSIFLCCIAPWWHPDMERISPSLALCEENTPVTENMILSLLLARWKLLNKLSICRWLETPWRF